MKTYLNESGAAQPLPALRCTFHCIHLLFFFFCPICTGFLLVKPGNHFEDLAHSVPLRSPLNGSVC